MAGLGALVDEPILTMWDRQGYDFGPGRKVFLYGLLTGRYQGGEVRNAVGEVEAIGYYRWHLGVEHTLVTRVKADLAKNLDGDTQLFLGNFNGLRGFETRRFAGEKRFNFNLEDRLFFVEDLFHLVSLGAVVFFDAGYVWGTEPGRRLSRHGDERGHRPPHRRAAGLGRGALPHRPRRAAHGRGIRPARAGVTVGTGQAFDPFQRAVRSAERVGTLDQPRHSTGVRR